MVASCNWSFFEIHFWKILCTVLPPCEKVLSLDSDGRKWKWNICDPEYLHVFMGLVWTKLLTIAIPKFFSVRKLPGKISCKFIYISIRPGEREKKRNTHKQRIVNTKNCVPCRFCLFRIPLPTAYLNFRNKMPPTCISNHGKTSHTTFGVPPRERSDSQRFAC